MRRSCPTWGIWSFCKNKSAAKSLLRHLSTRSAAEKMVAASSGYDLPSFEKLDDFKTWAEEGPPKGTLYHYPNPYNHQVLSIAAAPGPAEDRASDLRAGRADQDGGASVAERADGVGALLGRERGRRLHAHVRLPLVPSPHAS